MREFVLLQGDEACALGAVRPGAGSSPVIHHPATEIAETMARELPVWWNFYSDGR